MVETSIIVSIVIIIASVFTGLVVVINTVYNRSRYTYSDPHRRYCKKCGALQMEMEDYSGSFWECWREGSDINCRCRRDTEDRDP